MSQAAPRAHVTLEPRRLRSVRASLSATRWLLWAVALAGILATARNLIAAPHERTVVRSVSSPARSAGAQWLALSFTRAYLTWSADPSLHEQELSPFLAAGDDPDAGLRPAGGSTEAPRWLAIAAERDRPGGEIDYTVAASLGGGALRDVAVALKPTPGGDYVLARYPALVAAPQPRPAGALDGPGLPTVTNPAVTAVLERALRNYVDGSADNLDADLAPGATVVAAAPGLSLRSVVRLAAEPSGGVLATVLASDRDGDLFTLAYELSLRPLAGRWEITEIQP
jgi:hypothetical protein